MPIRDIRGVVEVPGGDVLGEGRGGGGQKLKMKLVKLENINSYQPYCKAPWPLHTAYLSKAKKNVRAPRPQALALAQACNLLLSSSRGSWRGTC